MEGSKIWVGVPVDGTLDSIIHRIPLMFGAEESISQLKTWGYEVGIISSGVSQFYLRPLTQRLQLDFAYSNILGETDGAHDGTVLIPTFHPSYILRSRGIIELVKSDLEKAINLK